MPDGCESSGIGSTPALDDSRPDLQPRWSNSEFRRRAIAEIYTMMVRPLTQTSGECPRERRVATGRAIERFDNHSEVIDLDVAASGPTVPGGEGSNSEAIEIDWVPHGVEEIGGVAVAEVVVRFPLLNLRLAVPFDRRFGALPGPVEVGVGTLDPPRREL